jgi:TolA-binding protein
LVQKRLTKRQIREDPLVTWTAKIETYSATHGKRVVMALGAVALAIVLGFVLRGARRGAELAAAELLAQAQYQLWSGSPAQAAELAAQVIERSPGTRSGRIAYLVRGDAFLQTGDAEGALEAFRNFLGREKRDKLLRLSARRGVAVALENAEKYAEAAAAYEELAHEGKPGTMAAQDLLAAARSRERAGDPAKARTLYQEVVDSYPKETSASDAKLRLVELEHRTGAP